MADVQLAGICKSFGSGSNSVTAVDNMELSIPDGSFVVLLGPTGAGKTTTLRLIAGLEKAEAGQILIAGQDISEYTPAQRNVAMVFQQYSLYPHMTVRDNLAFPLKSPIATANKTEIQQRVEEVAEVLQITAKLGNKATELSGGEMQRVSIGRALVRKPSIFLMDEPLSSLDAKLRSELRLELKRLQADLGSTFLYVTHDQIEAMTMATHIGVLDEGKLVQFGTPRDIYENPESIYVASRLGLPRINIFPANLHAGAPTAAVQLGLRPEHISLYKQSGSSEQQDDLSGVVNRVEALGDQTRLHLTVSDQPLVTLVEPQQKMRPGDSVSVTLNNPLYFDSNGVRVRQEGA